MHHIIFEQNTTYKVALLIRENGLVKSEIEKHYINRSELEPKDFIAFSLAYKDNGKAPAVYAREYMQKLLQPLKDLGVNTLFVCDSNYFKILTKVRKVDTSYGYVKKCVLEGFEDINVILSVNHKRLYFDPNLDELIELSIKTLDSKIKGISFGLGNDIIYKAEYPESYEEICQIINKLKSYRALTCDVETFSLKHYDTDIATIGFAWNEHEGCAFRVAMYSFYNKAESIKTALKEFFMNYTGTLIFHNANFDMKIIIKNLFMDYLTDQKGMLEGIKYLTRRFEDTKIIAYLAKNSTAKTNLGLKHLAFEFAGDYGEENIEDITKIPVLNLLEYNLKDCLSTWYVFNKYAPMMIVEKQQKIYKELFKPSIRNILQMELSGIPIDSKKIRDAGLKLDLIAKTARINIENNPLTQDFLKDLRYEEFIKKNKEWKRKNEPLEYFDYVEFKPTSNPQLQKFLYEKLKLPVLDTTDTGLPAVGSKTLKKLINHTDHIKIIDLLNNLVEMSTAEKITSTFIKAFLDNSCWCPKTKCYYLFGNFNLGGTVSGRLSSSGPNLQNIPSGSKYAKLIKECFIAPEGWIMCGADFDSLEDKISALTTKDPNKIKVYTDGYDGHCLRAYNYFGKDMDDIDPNSVTSINSIKKKYKNLRQKSKVPTFALTYNGTYHAIMDQTGLPKEEAQAIEKSYHEMYKVSDKWVADKLEEATRKGYVQVAFGLKVRTPILAKTILNTNSTPYEAKKEARTAGNALGQSYCLLNNRAANELQERILKSKYWNDIKPIMQIHDAMYFIVRNNIGAVKWLNDNLTECMSWQELPEIQHDEVKLSGAMDLFYPTWNNPIGLPVGADKKTILEICKKHT